MSVLKTPCNTGVASIASIPWKGQTSLDKVQNETTFVKVISKVNCSVANVHLKTHMW